MEYHNVHIHLFQFYSWREASTLQKSNSKLSYLQGSVAWKYLTAERRMLAIADTSLQLSVLYHCLLFKASTNLGKRLSQLLKYHLNSAEILPAEKRHSSNVDSFKSDSPHIQS